MERELGSWMDAALHYARDPSATRCGPPYLSGAVGKGQANFTPRSPEESILGREAGGLAGCVRIFKCEWQLRNAAKCQYFFEPVYHSTWHPACGFFSLYFITVIAQFTCYTHEATHSDWNAWTCPKASHYRERTHNTTHHNTEHIDTGYGNMENVAVLW